MTDYKSDQIPDVLKASIWNKFYSEILRAQEAELSRNICVAIWSLVTKLEDSLPAEGWQYHALIVLRDRAARLRPVWSEGSSAAKCNNLHGNPTRKKALREDYDHLNDWDLWRPS